MKIAFIVDSFPKASETFILNQITGLIDRGHEIEIFAKRGLEGEQIHNSIKEYDLLANTNYTNTPQNKIHRFFNAGRLIATETIRQPHRVLESLQFRKYGPDSRSLRLLHRSISFKDEGFDVLFCHYAPNGNLGALLKRTGTDANLVTMFHGYGVRRGLEKGEGMYAPAFEYSDFLLANSKYTKKNLIKLGADPDSIYCHPIGISLDKFQFEPIDVEGMSDRVVCISTVGRLVEEKGYQYSLRAIADVMKRNPGLNIEYQIAGDGPMKEELRYLVQDLDIEDSVNFLGQVERSAVVELLENTDLFVLSSVKEGLGKVLLEAQATGVPVVATKVGGIPQAVNPGESAILVPPKNPTALSHMIEHLCENPERLPKMGRSGRKYVEQHFDLEDLNDELECLFNSLIQRDNG
ncbi:glycosyltransferase [Natrialba sp. SSL1]|uniref:glycosyltransferase n=1 Tax=Natrialba sp. SSL1 TaxID=1869245 RepID=UPI000A04FB14|nr:glycosyltransferase [Natrialba sp. SSL1]